jgi:multidrug efflux pump subunit AcrB
MIRNRRAVIFAVLVALLTYSSATAAAPDAITVTAAYPGANCQVVADTIAGPIEEQVNGVEGMLHLMSRCGNDGTYTLTVTFKPGTDVKVAQVLVQNRVSLAAPLLPDVVKRAGVTVKRQPADVLLFVAVSSPGSRRDILWLSRYAELKIRDELARLPGVGEVYVAGYHDFNVRVMLDPKKLAAYNLGARDVITALRTQNLQVGAEPIGPPIAGKEPKGEILVSTFGRLTDEEQFAKIILKTVPGGGLVYLKDVATVELGATGPDVLAILNGQPVVLLGVRPTRQAQPRDVSAAVKKVVSRLRPGRPEGVRIELAFDFTPNREAAGQPTTRGYLLLDLSLPDGVSPERTFRVVEHVAGLLKKLDGVQDVLGLSDNPLDGVRSRPCILVRLADKGAASREEVRKRLGGLGEVAVRIRDLSGPGVSYPIDFAVHGPEADRVRKLADRLARHLRHDPKLTDVWADTASAPHKQLYLDIDRRAAANRGVALNGLYETLEAVAGPLYVFDRTRTSRTWQVPVPSDPLRDRRAALKSAKIRNAKGEMVALADIASVRDIEGPDAIDHLDRKAMVRITANPAVGVTPAEARTRCASLAEQVRKELRLPADYKLTWLRDPPR